MADIPGDYDSEMIPQFALNGFFGDSPVYDYSLPVTKDEIEVHLSALQLLQNKGLFKSFDEIYYAFERLKSIEFDFDAHELNIHIIEDFIRYLWVPQND